MKLFLKCRVLVAFCILCLFGLSGCSKKKVEIQNNGISLSNTEIYEELTLNGPFSGYYKLNQDQFELLIDTTAEDIRIYYRHDLLSEFTSNKLSKEYSNRVYLYDWFIEYNDSDTTIHVACMDSRYTDYVCKVVTITEQDFLDLLKN